MPNWERGCPYLHFDMVKSPDKGGWWYREDFLVDGVYACELKCCGHEQCRCYGKPYDQPQKLLGPLLRR